MHNFYNSFYNKEFEYETAVGGCECLASTEL